MSSINRQKSTKQIFKKNQSLRNGWNKNTHSESRAANSEGSTVTKIHQAGQTGSGEPQHNTGNQWLNLQNHGYTLHCPTLTTQAPSPDEGWVTCSGGDDVFLSCRWRPCTTLRLLTQTSLSWRGATWFWWFPLLQWRIRWEHLLMKDDLVIVLFGFILSLNPRPLLRVQELACSKIASSPSLTAANGGC